MIGSARRECIDQVIVFGETHLRCLMWEQLYSVWRRWGAGEGEFISRWQR